MTPLNSYPATASKFSSNRAGSWSPKSAPNSLDHGLVVHLYLHTITTCRYISNIAWWWPSSVYDLVLQVKLHTRSIATSKFRFSKPLRPFPNLHNYNLQVYLSLHSILASEYMLPGSFHLRNYTYTPVSTDTKVSTRYTGVVLIVDGYMPLKLKCIESQYKSYMQSGRICIVISDALQWRATQSCRRMTQ